MKKKDQMSGDIFSECNLQNSFMKRDEKPIIIAK